MPFKLTPIVEGPGEERALPILLRRLLLEKFGLNPADIQILPPKNARGCGQLTNADPKAGIERYVRHAIKEQCDCVLVLIDNDPAKRLKRDRVIQDDCAPEFAHYLVQRLRNIYCAKPVVVVVARWEYEAWFLANLERIGSLVGIAEGVVFEGDVESVGSPKGWIARRLPPGRSYSETVDQPALTRVLDLDVVAQRSRSFRRLQHALEELIEATLQNQPLVTPLPQEVP